MFDAGTKYLSAFFSYSISPLLASTTSNPHSPLSTGAVCTNCSARSANRAGAGTVPVPGFAVVGETLLVCWPWATPHAPAALAANSVHNAALLHSPLINPRLAIGKICGLPVYSKSVGLSHTSSRMRREARRAKFTYDAVAASNVFRARTITSAVRKKVRSNEKVSSTCPDFGSPGHAPHGR